MAALDLPWPGSVAIALPSIVLVLRLLTTAGTRGSLLLLSAALVVVAIAFLTAVLL